MSKMILISEDTVKLALEALEDTVDHTEIGSGPNKKAITALREALQTNNEVVSAVAEQPAQQEPIGELTMGGIVDTSSGPEYGDWDAEWDTKAVEALQERLVTGDAPVTVSLYTSPPANRKPLPDGIASPDELEALSDGNSGMIFNEGFPTKLDRLACWLREYAAPQPAQQPAQQEPVRIYDYVWPQRDEHKEECVYACSYTPGHHLARGELLAVVHPSQLTNVYLQRDGEAAHGIKGDA